MNTLDSAVKLLITDDPLFRKRYEGKPMSKETALDYIKACDYNWFNNQLQTFQFEAPKGTSLLPAGVSDTLAVVLSVEEGGKTCIVWSLGFAETDWKKNGSIAIPSKEAVLSATVCETTLSMLIADGTLHTYTIGDVVRKQLILKLEEQPLCYTSVNNVTIISYPTKGLLIYDVSQKGKKNECICLSETPADRLSLRGAMLTWTSGNMTHGICITDPELIQWSEDFWNINEVENKDTIVGLHSFRDHVIQFTKDKLICTDTKLCQSDLLTINEGIVDIAFAGSRTMLIFQTDGTMLVMNVTNMDVMQRIVLNVKWSETPRTRSVFMYTERAILQMPNGVAMIICAI